MPVLNKVPELVAKKFGGDDNIVIQQVSDATGLSYPTTHEWIRGKVLRVDLNILAKWCKYLKVQPGDILVYEED